MSRQNRVTPFGQIIAVPERGTLMGNRGILHDANGQPKRNWATKAWIICSLALRPGRKPLQVMAPRHYTPLFFLDEATALAAGHRPCAECRRPAYNRFKSLWLGANADLIQQANPPIAVIDGILHQERLTERRNKRMYQARLADLPNGTFIALDEMAYLVWEQGLLCWSLAGYVEKVTRPGSSVVNVLTPPSVVKILAAGLHAGNPSVGQSMGELMSKIIITAGDVSLSAKLSDMGSLALVTRRPKYSFRRGSHGTRQRAARAGLATALSCTAGCVTGQESGHICSSYTMSCSRPPTRRPHNTLIGSATQNG